MGLVCRDRAGTLLWAFSDEVRAQSAYHAELSAVRRAILLCLDLEMVNVIIESDNASIIFSLATRASGNGE